MSSSPTISRKTELLEADVDGELIALSVDSGTCYGFNPTATRIWALLEQPKSLSALCDALVADFEVDRATCERDVVALLDDLRKDGLIEVKGILPGGAA